MGSKVPVSFVATMDAEGAKSFYEQVLGLKLIEATPYALVFDDGGHTLRVQIVDSLEPAGHTVYGWVVEDIEREIEDLTSKGVRFETFAQLEQDQMGIWTTPAGQKIAWFKDPGGNILSLTQKVP